MIVGGNAAFDKQTKTMTAKIYLVERTDEIGWDQYESFVCVANNGHESRRIHPDHHIKWGGEKWSDNYHQWALPKVLKSTEIGISLPTQNPGDVLHVSYKNG